MAPELPPGATWATTRRWPHLERWRWWRYAGQTTIYAGRFHTPVVFCDSEVIADAVLDWHESRLEVPA